LWCRNLLEKFFAKKAKMTHSNLQGQYLNTLRHFQQEYGAKYGITRIGIFGSVARGEQTEESDVDVLVEAPTIDAFSLAGVRLRLEEMLSVPVDVVRKSEYLPEKFKARIEKEVIYV